MRTPLHSRATHARPTWLSLVILSLLLAAAVPAGAIADGSVRILAPRATSTSGAIRYIAKVSGSSREVSFLVDGRARWRGRVHGKHFQRAGYLPASKLGNGRHALLVRVRRRGGRVVSAKRVVHVSNRSRVIGGEQPTSTPTSAPEPAPAVPTEPQSTPPPSVEETASAPAPAPSPAPTSSLVEAGFENGLQNWNTAGVGEVVPTTASDIVREGSKAARVALTGTQKRSELILGGTGTDEFDPWKFNEGDEYFYGFSFYIDSMVYGYPGAHNLIMQLKGHDEESPYFALGLWDYGNRGLWVEEGETSVNRFLSPVSEHQWHDVAVHFRDSATGTGFYEVFLDGSLIGSRNNVSLMSKSADFAYIKNGIYRSSKLTGTSEIRLDAAKLGRTWDSVQAG